MIFRGQRSTVCGPRSAVYVIEINDLTFTYPGQTTPLFDHFTWHVERGEFWSVIGPSGGGKSTLLHLIVGVRLPSAGEITVNGEHVPRKKNRGKTGLVLQDYGLLPWATVRENVALGLRVRAFYGQDGASRPPTADGRRPPTDRRATNGEILPRHDRQGPFLASAQDDKLTAVGGPRSAVSSQLAHHDRVDFWLERFGLTAHRDKYPSQISGGQRQRAAIARTLVLEPDVLLLDEPFSALDAPTREDLEQLTLDLQAETKMTTVFVTHNIEEAVFLGRKILVLGNPPHRSPIRCFENPGAGRAEYRDDPTFAQQAHMLRDVLRSS